MAVARFLPSLRAGHEQLLDHFNYDSEVCSPLPDPDLLGT